MWRKILQLVIEQRVKKGKNQLKRSDEFAAKYPHLLKRDTILRALRSYFYSQDFHEVTTPSLQVSPGLEPHLQAFETIWENPVGRRQLKFYLHTSPEFAMKKLLVSGMKRIFQVAQVHRNREWSDTHHPEFSMVEWYRVDQNYEAIMEDCERLLLSCALAIGATHFTWKGAKSLAQGPFERLSVEEAFLKYAGFSLLATIDDPLAPGAERLREKCAALGIHHHPSDQWEDLFFRIFLESIEPKLGIDRPTILYDYPISMAALSRPKAGAPHLAERFEIYVAGLELANAFGELTDPIVQKKRFEADMEKKFQLYGNRYPIDEDFIAALEEGMPASAGIALGFDRLVMLLTGASKLEDVLWLPMQHPEKD